MQLYHKCYCVLERCGFAAADPIKLPFQEQGDTISSEVITCRVYAYYFSLPCLLILIDMQSKIQKLA